MKISYVNYEDSIGRRFNGYNLCEYFSKKGLSCFLNSHIVTNPKDFTIGLYCKKIQRAARRVSLALEKRLSVQNLLFPPVLSFRKNIREADLIHFHLISHYYLSFWEIAYLSRYKPLVLTLHEYSPFTGYCPYPVEGCKKWIHGCTQCPDITQTFPLKSDRTHLLWKYKYKIWQNIKPTVVVSSKWFLNEVNKSPMFNECEKHIIPFGLDLNLFKPGDKLKARKKLSIPEDDFVIFFRALDSPYKGLNIIIKALRELKPGKNISLITLNGVGALDEFLGRYRLIEFDYINNENEMVTLYQASDLFLMPSTQETFGMMAMEAMACGIPSIVSEDTPLVEVTRAPEAADTIPQQSYTALLASIQSFINNPEKKLKMGRRARALAEELYDFETHAESLKSLYKTCIKSNSQPDI